MVAKKAVFFKDEVSVKGRNFCQETDSIGNIVNNFIVTIVGDY